MALSALLLAAGAAGANGAIRLVDQGWSIVHRPGRRIVELRAWVVNHGETPMSYRVRFLVEQWQPSPGPRSVPAGTPVPDAEDDSWVTVKVVPAPPGSLAPGASAPVRAELPYDELTPGRQHRFRAEVIDTVTGAPVDSVTITKLAPALTFGGQVLAIEALLEGSSTRDAGVSGRGVMVGQHEAHRVGGEWVENGSGTIELGTLQGRLLLEYAYTSRGTSAAALQATATATGDLIGPEGAVPVTITSASARMTSPGTRQETQQIIRRSGATASGTFFGTVGDDRWSGLLTLRDGTQTLDPTTGMGQHTFTIELVQAINETGLAHASRGGQDAGER